MMKIKYTAIAFLAVLTFVSCQSHKNALNMANPLPPVTPTETLAASAITKIAQSFGDWKTMKAGGNVSISGSKSLSSSMQVKMIKDKSIYISVRPMGILEVAKLVITGDTLIVVDKIHKQYLCENVKLITNEVPANVSTLQDIFLGRAFILGQGTLSPDAANLVELTTVQDNYLLQPKEQYKGFNYDFKFDSDHKILSVEVTPIATTAAQASTYAVNYSDVKSTVAGNVAGKISVSSKLKNTSFNLKLEYGSFNWNDNITIDTKLPTNYRRIAGESFLNMFGQ